MSSSSSSSSRNNNLKRKRHNGNNGNGSNVAVSTLVDYLTSSKNNNNNSNSSREVLREAESVVTSVAQLGEWLDAHTADTGLRNGEWRDFYAQLLRERPDLFHDLTGTTGATVVVGAVEASLESGDDDAPTKRKSRRTTTTTTTTTTDTTNNNNSTNSRLGLVKPLGEQLVYSSLPIDVHFKPILPANTDVQVLQVTPTPFAHIHNNTTTTTSSNSSSTLGIVSPAIQRATKLPPHTLPPRSALAPFLPHSHPALIAQRDTLPLGTFVSYGQHCASFGPEWDSAGHAVKLWDSRGWHGTQRNVLDWIATRNWLDELDDQRHNQLMEVIATTTSTTTTTTTTSTTTSESTAFTDVDGEANVAAFLNELGIDPTENTQQEPMNHDMVETWLQEITQDLFLLDHLRRARLASLPKHTLNTLYESQQSLIGPPRSSTSRSPTQPPRLSIPTAKQALITPTPQERHLWASITTKLEILLANVRPGTGIMTTLKHTLPSTRGGFEWVCDLDRWVGTQPLVYRGTLKPFKPPPPATLPPSSHSHPSQSMSMGSSRLSGRWGRRASQPVPSVPLQASQAFVPIPVGMGRGMTGPGVMAVQLGMGGGASGVGGVSGAAASLRR